MKTENDLEPFKIILIITFWETVTYNNGSQYWNIRSPEKTFFLNSNVQISLRHIKSEWGSENNNLSKKEKIIMQKLLILICEVYENLKVDIYNKNV